MDLFYLSLPGSRKQRLHFHRFMLRVHEELTALQGKSDPGDCGRQIQGGNGRALL